MPKASIPKRLGRCKHTVDPLDLVHHRGGDPFAGQAFPRIIRALAPFAVEKFRIQRIQPSSSSPLQRLRAIVFSASTAISTGPVGASAIGG
jgi:hypothetical protein